MYNYIDLDMLQGIEEQTIPGCCRLLDSECGRSGPGSGKVLETRGMRVALEVQRADFKMCTIDSTPKLSDGGAVFRTGAAQESELSDGGAVF